MITKLEAPGLQTGRRMLGALIAALFTTVGMAGVAYGEDTQAGARAATRMNGMQLAQAAPARPAAVALQAEMDALIKAAKAEGELFFYTAPVDTDAKRLADGFQAKYGIRANFLRLIGGPLFTRFSAEAESNNIPADVSLVSGTSSVNFAEEGIKKGWVESVAQAGLPVLRSGEFPARHVQGPVAIIQFSVWGITYNNEKLKGADVPKDFPDLLKPQYKGQLLLPDPRVADAYVEFWSLIMDKYGESYLTAMKAQNPRFFASGAPALNELAAGGGTIQMPGLAQQMWTVKTKGGPVDFVTPEFTTGAENYVMLTARAKAKRPAAGRLFANYVMSPEGNKLLNNYPGGINVYDTSGLPKQYSSPKFSALARKDQISKLLGVTN